MELQQSKASRSARTGELPQAGAWCQHPQSLPNRWHQ